MLRDSAIDGGRRGAPPNRPPTAPPTCVGEASTKKTREGLKISAIHTDVTARLREGDGAHAPTAHHAFNLCERGVSRESPRGFKKKRDSNGRERCAYYVTARLREGDGEHAPAALSSVWPRCQPRR